MSYLSVPEALDDLVKLAGGTPEGVAKILADRMVVAACNEPMRCAIAAWLITNVDPAPVGVMVWPHREPSEGHVTWETDRFSASGGTVITTDSVDLPDALNQFAIEFDHGAFPELIDSLHPGEPCTDDCDWGH